VLKLPTGASSGVLNPGRNKEPYYNG